MNNNLSFQVIIEKDTDSQDNTTVYTASCPVLGLYDYGKNIEEAYQRIKSLIEFHIQTLQKEGQKIPTSNPETFVSTVNFSNQTYNSV